MGVKSIAKHLNESGIRTRDGGRWGVDAVHKVLTRTTYIGRHRFNTKYWKTRERKPETEVVEMAVPPIIEAAEFEAVQTLRASQACRRMRTGSGGYRRDQLRALAQRVEVDAKEVRIMGSKSVLLRTLVAASSAKTAGFGVPSFVPKWRATQNKTANPYVIEISM
jgi:hypothetical protein